MIDNPEGAVSVEETDAILSVYANAFTLNISHDDAVIVMGQRRPEKPGESKGVVKVYMTINALKQLAVTLTAAAEQHDNFFSQKPTFDVQLVDPANNNTPIPTPQKNVNTKTSI